ncbi:DNA-binding transcriptional regulator GbsR, MarR family [Gillisia sp. Hel1_33_143]|uniref:GbsR/MarR family transcriptional regulator n=1 Tax=unclassified Gillisia TaxID=2615025 RepID=UPI0005562D94|nr:MULTISPECIES: helix-turn-helix domain-containing protein [unclassified Gillisia]SDR89825.1 DNA-binding transcriptional regulator GbsR, MarR family [Gillisia sp. Hel1_33_143]
MQEKEDLLERKNKLVERFGVFIEHEDKMAPLEARIFSTLLLTGKGGITFENLVKDLNASKSTICTHLNTLQASGRVSYFTKPGDRKRYFNLTPNRLVQVMDEMLDNWNKQYDIHSDIINYKKEANNLIEDETEAYELQFHENYIQFLEDMANAVKKLKKNISEIKN